ARSPRCATSAVLDLECETAKALQDRAVEGVLVLLGGVVIEGRGEVVSQVGKHLGASLYEVDVVAVAFLGIAATGSVLRPLRHDSAGSELTDRFGDASDVVGDGRNPGSQSLEQRTALVELGAIGEQGDSGLGQGALEVAPGEVAETPLGHISGVGSIAVERFQ